VRADVVDVVESEPDLFGDPYAAVSAFASPDESLVVRIVDAHPKGMGGPVVGYATVTHTATGDTRSLRNIQRPNHYQPWIGTSSRMAWLGLGWHITDCDTGDEYALQMPPKYANTMLGSPSLPRLVVGDRTRFCLYDEDGFLLHATNEVGRHHAFGFSDHSGLALRFVRATEGEPPLCHGYAAMTGEPKGTIDLTDVHPVVEQSLAAAGSSDLVVWKETGIRASGSVLGSIEGCIGPEGDLLWMRLLVPTGEIETIPTAPLVSEAVRPAIEERSPDMVKWFFPDTNEHTVVDERWLAIRITH